MGVSLKKGTAVSLTKAAPGLKNIVVGLGWDAQARGATFDLDASVFCVGQHGRVYNSDDFIFYNNLRSSDGAIEHTGDNRTGAGEGDDEAIKVALNRVASHVVSMVFAVTIHEGEEKRQHFGQVKNAFIRIINADTNQELARYDLAERFSGETALIFGDVYRAGNEWVFRAIGHGMKGGLPAACALYGVPLS